MRTLHGQTFSSRDRHHPVSADRPGRRKTPPCFGARRFPGDDLILCQITTRARSDGFSIPLDATDFARGQLSQPSFIRPQRLFTVEQRVILYSTGKVLPAKLAEVLSKARDIFKSPSLT